MKWKVILFCQVFRYVPIIQQTFLSIGQGLSISGNVTVFKLWISLLNFVSSKCYYCFWVCCPFLNHCVRNMFQQDLFIRFSKCNNILCAEWYKKPLLGIRFPHLLVVFSPNIEPLICIVINIFNSLYKAQLLWKISSALSIVSTLRSDLPYGIMHLLTE